ncbi:MAG: YfcE family phosphodiesterase [Eggerthellaceae bacterium]|nr:YfcE family phosphodiesterase [Eggerthellaceae bacterium]
MTRIGVISDTHGVLVYAVHGILSDCDWIFHAGDICDPAILRELKTIAPTIAVLGNNDFNEYGARVTWKAFPEIDGVHFFMTHKPNDLRRYIAQYNAPVQEDSGNIPDVVIHGHTHVPALEQISLGDKVAYLLCPGSVSYPRENSPRSVAKIDIAEGQVVRLSLETLEGAVIQVLDAVR